MKACIFILMLFLPPTSEAAERIHGAGATLEFRPATAYGRAIHRQPVTEKEREAAVANKVLFGEIKPGQTMIIQNSVHELDDEVVTVSDVFEDGTVRVKRRNGKLAFVRGKNLADTLSPETDCGMSHGEKICRGQTVFYPVRTTSLELPEGEVAHIFANGSVVVEKDAIEYVLDLKQVGVSKKCSPQRESICVNDYVYAEGYKENHAFSIEGTIGKMYSNGIGLVLVDSRWRYPIEVSAMKKRIAAEDPFLLNPSVITTRGSRGKELRNVMPELEPLDPNTSIRDTR